MIKTNRKRVEPMKVMSREMNRQTMFHQATTGKGHTRVGKHSSPITRASRLLLVVIVVLFNSLVHSFVIRPDTISTRTSPTNIISGRTSSSLANPTNNAVISPLNNRFGPSLFSLEKKATTTKLYGSNLKDYSDAAQALFGNLIGPASMLAGGLVPLGFLAPPLPDKTKRQRKLKCIFMFLSVFSLASDLISIIYATVACNKLTETPTILTESAFALIKRDYEISWLGTNLHFMMALCGMLSMVMIRALSMFPNPLKGPSAGIAGSVILLSLSIINRGVTVGDGRGHRFGGSLLTLLGRYFYLLIKKVPQRGPMEISALIMASVSFVFCIKALFMDEPPSSSSSEEEEEESKEESLKKLIASSLKEA